MLQLVLWLLAGDVAGDAHMGLVSGSGEGEPAQIREHWPAVLELRIRAVTGGSAGRVGSGGSES